MSAHAECIGWVTSEFCPGSTMSSMMYLKDHHCIVTDAFAHSEAFYTMTKFFLFSFWRDGLYVCSVGYGLGNVIGNTIRLCKFMASNKKIFHWECLICFPFLTMSWLYLWSFMNDNKELISIFTVTLAFYLTNQSHVLRIVCSYRSSKDSTPNINFASINRMKALQPHDPFFIGFLPSENFNWHKCHTASKKLGIGHRMSML